MANPRGIRAGAAYVELFVSDSKLVRGLASASRKLKAFGEAISGWGQTLATLGAAVTAPLLGSAKVFGQMGDQIAKASARTGVSVESLSELAYAAELSGASLETLEAGLRRMQRSLVEAAQGSQMAVEALALLGLTVEDFRGISPEQQFKLIADRLKMIQSPAVRAAAAMELLGRSGTQLLPLMMEGSKGIAALQQQASDLGLTMSSEDAKAAELLNDTFDTLWKVLKQGVFVIGSALAPIMKDLTEWIIRTVVTTTAWIKQNKQLVVMILKVAAAVVAGGLALMALGFAVTMVGAILGALAAIIATIGSALGVLGSIMAALVTPIGLVITAATVLGASLWHMSAAGGQALAWLQERFAELAEFARESFRGIADALMAGDITLAARILWLSLKVIGFRGVLELTRLWEGLKSGTLQIVYGLWYGVQAAWEIGVASVAGLMLKLYYGVLEVWQRLSTGVMNVWDSAINWVAQRIVDLWGLVDDTLDPRKVKEQLDQDTQGRIGQRNQEKDQSLQRIAGERDLALQQLQQEHERTLARIGQASINAEHQLDTEAQKKIDAAQAELETARREWQEAIGQARQKRESLGTGPDRFPGRGRLELGDDLEALAAQLVQAQQNTIDVVGTFNAAPGSLQGLQGASDAADRTAKATEETARHTKRLVQAAQSGGLTFT